MAAVRATKEATVDEDGESLPVIVGTPMKGETIDGETFDGEAAHRHLSRRSACGPCQGRAGRQAGRTISISCASARRGWRKPIAGVTLSLPHIRLDRALEFLLGDKLK